MHTNLMFSRSLLCLALAAAFPAFAEDEVERLIKPESNVTLGIGSVNADNQRFGTYNGVAAEGEHLIGEAAIVRRDDASATWFRLDARNLGLTTRELRLDHERQGDWAYYLEYNQTPRVAPYDVHTGVSGIGTTTQTPPNALGVRSTAGETEIRTDRYKTTVGYYKALTAGWDFNFKFQSEEKKGSRLFGRGTSGGGGVQEFLAEPINSTTRQLDMTVDYAGERLQLQAGYYGSFYNNRNPALLITGGNANFAGATPHTVIALPPDNLAHQIHASGGYDFTATTRGTFRYSYTKNTQTDAFVPIPTGMTNISGRSDLGGRVDTTLLQMGLTSRPISKLSLVANLRYEDRDDKTAIAKYIDAGGSTDGYNEPRSLKIVSGKFEASYQLPQGVRATGGLDVENKQRSMSGLRAVAYREKTEETSWRFELRRSLFEAVSGAIGVVHSNRNGSAYPIMRNFDGSLYNNTGGVLQPIYIADRDRNKLKAAIDWAPLEALSLQFLLEDSRDRYGPGRGNPDVGPRSGDAQLYSLDASYAVSDKWQLTAYVSELKTRIAQATGAAAASYWTADMRNTGINYGFGVKGKPTGKLELGADLLFAEDLSRYAMAGTPVTAQLPDINNVQTTFKLFASYAWDKNTDVRLDYIHDRRKTNDWTWNGTTTPYIYTDGTWLYQNPNQTVNFVGVSVKYSFR